MKDTMNTQQPSTITATVIADSISTLGNRITTLQLKYPRFIHSEFMTHRVFSRNSASSRAIPVAKMIAQVQNDPAMPIYWGLNQPGMQASKEHEDISTAQVWWKAAAIDAAASATLLNDLGLHKQIVNRVLEPFQWMHTIVTATEWDNFFELRCHPDAQPEFQVLACAIRTAMEDSAPVVRACERMGWNGAWHLPYVLDDERASIATSTLTKLSAARCARVSYLKHDGTTPNIEDDLTLFERLVGGKPLHASPIEHQAWAAGAEDRNSRNFFGWHQYRALFESGLMK